MIGVVLAGGWGTRLGRGSKAAAIVAGRPLASYPVAALGAVCGRVAVVCKPDTELPELGARALGRAGGAAPPAHRDRARARDRRGTRARVRGRHAVRDGGRLPDAASGRGLGARGRGVSGRRCSSPRSPCTPPRRLTACARRRRTPRSPAPWRRSARARGAARRARAQREHAGGPGGRGGVAGTSLSWLLPQARVSIATSAMANTIWAMPRAVPRLAAPASSATSGGDRDNRDQQRDLPCELHPRSPPRATPPARRCRRSGPGPASRRSASRRPPSARSARSPCSAASSRRAERRRARGRGARPRPGRARCSSSASASSSTPLPAASDDTASTGTSPRAHRAQRLAAGRAARGRPARPGPPWSPRARRAPP